MIPYIHVDIDFEPDLEDIGNLYESVRAAFEQVQHYGNCIMTFNVSIMNDDDEELFAFKI